MTRSHRILVLTDHSGHSDQNSIYAILNNMRLDQRCTSIHVASRGLAANDSFFLNMNEDGLHGVEIDHTFGYSQSGDAYSEGLSRLDLKSFDVVLMRLPRPVSDHFLKWLEDLFSHAVIINRPSGIIETSNKSFLVAFPDLCPDTKLCHSINDILAETQKYPIVLKPLREYGGKGLLKINGSVLNDGNRDHDTLNYLQTIKHEIEAEGYLSMRFLKNVSQGDKRILVVDGEILASSLRIPAEDSWLCNVAQGGTSVASEVTDREKQIINKINPSLRERGILIYGADTLVDDDGERVLSEVNTLSIGGFPQAEAQTGRPIIQLLINKIMDYADEWAG